MWNHTGVAKQLGIRYPIIQAGMAGITSPSLVAAVSNAGGLGTLGAGYMSRQEITSTISEIQRLTDKPFAVNLFVTQRAIAFSEQLQKVQTKLAPFRMDLGIDEPDAIDFDLQDLWEQVDAVLECNVPIVSFTFGIPSEEIMSRLFHAKVTLLGTATTVKEAMLLEDAGFHMVIAQGSEAGGHRATFESNDDVPLIGSMSLIPQVVDQITLPVIAAGGIMDGRGIVAAMALGAQAVQLGTAFLLTTESSAVSAYKKAVFDSHDESTIMTKLFSGKPARAIENRFTKALHDLESEVPPFPLQNSLTNDIRKAARQQGVADMMSLYAGQSSGIGRMMDAAQLIEILVQEVEASDFRYREAQRD